VKIDGTPALSAPAFGQGTWKPPGIKRVS